MHEAVKLLHATDGMLDDDAPFGMGSIGDLLGASECRRRVVLRFARLLVRQDDLGLFAIIARRTEKAEINERGLGGEPRLSGVEFGFQHGVIVHMTTEEWADRDDVPVRRRDRERFQGMALFFPL